MAVAMMRKKVLGHLISHSSEALRPHVETIAQCPKSVLALHQFIKNKEPHSPVTAEQIAALDMPEDTRNLLISNPELLAYIESSLAQFFAKS